MDDLAEALSGFGVTKTLNDPSAPHPRYSLYKQKTGVDQTERRRRMLENQKDRRFNAKAHIRALSGNCWDEVEYKDGEDMDTEVYKPKHPGRYYRNQLMLSEWMIEVPERFEEDWLMVACPVGKRCLVLAGNGYSSAYGKSGHYVLESFQSHLPGGWSKYASRQDSSCSTILDCIYSDVTRTFYVLDMMCWNDMEVYNSDVEFRLFWLRAKLAEQEEDLTVLKKSNEFRFIPLEFLPCDENTIRQTLDQWKPNELDGLLFYHKRVHYLFGANPLCLWLQAYMVGDLLRVPVPRAHMDRAPQGYVSFQHHTEQVKEKKAIREEKERQRQEKRDKQLDDSLTDMGNGDMGSQQSPQNMDSENATTKGKKKKNNKGKNKVSDDMQTEAPPAENDGG